MCWYLLANGQIDEFRKQYDEFKRQAEQKYENFRDKANKEYAKLIKDALPIR